MTKTVSPANPLKPEHHPQLDLFLCDVSDAILKDAMAEMEHPFYSLSKNPDMHAREYHHGDNWIRITPSYKGLATIYDKDILIYAISQLMAKKKNGEKISKRVRIKVHDYLVFTNRRAIGGKEYAAFIDALERLRGITITTNIRTGDVEQTDIFGIIDSASVKRKFGLDGRLEWAELNLSDWLFNAIEAHEVLTLHRDYFRLKKPMERRVYEIARKHCGRQKSWTIGLDKLLNKSGARSPKKKFKFMLNELAKTDHLPDYQIKVDGDNVIFTNRGTMELDEPDLIGQSLSAGIYDAAREAAPGWDVRMIEQEWRNYVVYQKKPVKSPDAAFLGFCKKWFEKRGRP